ncbi:MAG TPA: SRPBCC domain-containing protein [Bacteroidia bacterium]|nr:SRPBCC domain-containing protein [Bacteroidia bacterium]HNT81000.1 SRPBCC domain-containing protein [Bacteroidia bacterium]
MNPKHNWSFFKKRIAINCTVKEAYDMWTQSGNLLKWFLRVAEFRDKEGKLKSGNESAVKGDQYVFMWHGWPDEVCEKNEILKANGMDFFSFQFGKAGKVDVTLSLVMGLTVVEIHQYEIPTDEESKFNFHVGCSEGWTFYLANLKSLLEGGLDLRNKDMKISGVVNS